MRPKNPTANRAYRDNANRHRRIVERLRRHRVGGGQTENDGDEYDPGDADEANGAREAAQVKGSFDEGAGVEGSKKDGDAVGDVKADGCDGGRG